MKRQKVFISYASEDSYFVPLAARLLEVHNLEPWFARSHLRGGDLFVEKIEEELAASDILVVVISEHAKASKWVTAEIAKFTTQKPNAPVIPARLEEIDLDEVAPGLSRRQWVDFSNDLLAGFRDLHAALGRDFLSRKELADRRSGGERRDPDDRRKSDVNGRVSMGLLVAYTRHTGNNVVDDSPLSPGDIRVLRAPAMVELRRYDYRNPCTGEETAVEAVVDEAFEFARGEIETQGGLSALTVLGILARHVCDSYDVAMKERRTEKRRRGDGRHTEKA